MIGDDRFKVNVDIDGVYQGQCDDASKKPERREKPGRCKICGTPLNSYRLGKYCGVHQIQGTKLEDKKEDDKKRLAKSKEHKKRKELKNGNKSSKRRSTKRPKK